MFKFIYILFFFLSFFSAAFAQEKKYVYYDSSLMNPREEYQSPVSPVSADTALADDHAATDVDEQSTITDTTLYPNQLTIPPDSVQNWKNLKAFEYAKYLDSLLKAKQDAENTKVSDPIPTSSGPGWLDSLFASPVTKFIFWGLAGLFILFILYKLFLTEGVFRRESKTGESTAPEVAEEIITNESNFDAMISQAIRSGNYRLAVRYQYLKTLHKLADKHFIELAADKTNYQYVSEMAVRGGPFKNDFASLTLSYEYVWYGEFAIEETIYHKIESGFTNFNQKF
jgi:hypothetical protein